MPVTARATSGIREDRLLDDEVGKDEEDVGSAGKRGCSVCNKKERKRDHWQQAFELFCVYRKRWLSFRLYFLSIFYLFWEGVTRLALAYTYKKGNGKHG